MAKKEGFLEKVMGNPEQQKRVYLVVILIIGLILLSMYRAGSEDSMRIENNAPVSKDVQDKSDFELQRLEREIAASLARILSDIDGAGKVVVEVSLAKGPEFLYIEDRTNTQKTTEERDDRGGTRDIIEVSYTQKTVIAKNRDGDEPVLSQIIPSEVRGVLVVAEGADDSEVRLALSRAVSTLLDIPPHRVEVVTGKGD